MSNRHGSIPAGSAFELSLSYSLLLSLALPCSPLLSLTLPCSPLLSLALPYSPLLSLTLPSSPSLSHCGQTLNNDGLLSVWFNVEDCLAYVRDAYFLNR